MLNHFTFSALLTSVTTFILGTFVLFKSLGKKKLLFRIFALYTFSISTWSLSASFFNPSFSDHNLLTGRLLHVGAIFIPILYLHFSLLFLDIYEQKKILVKTDYIIGLIFLYLDLFTNLLIKGVTHKTTYSFPTPSILYPIFFLFFFSNVTYALLKFYSEYKKCSGDKRNQIKYLFWGSLVGYTGGLNHFLITANIELFPLHPFGAYAISVYVAIATYAIVKYRLMDITVAVTRTGIFIAVYTLILGLPFAVAIQFKSWLVETFGAQWWMFPLILMATLATFGPFIYIYFQRRAENRLLREQKRYQQTLKQASVGMTRIRDLHRLLDLITHIVTKTVKIVYAAIYLYNKDADEYLLQVSRDKGRIPIPKITSDNPLVAWVTLKREPLIYEEVKRHMEDTNNETFRLLEENMRLLTATVVIPSFLEDRFMGFFVLGEKVSGQIYTPEDLNVFQILASQAALAIENAQFYEDAKEMQEQIAQAEKMATIGTMADGLSHQINNRFYTLSLIAGDTIDTIKLTDTSKCTPEVKEMIDSINHALERIQSNVVQGGEVVRGLLKYSRKGDAGFEALDLNKVIDNTLEMVQYKVKLSEIDIIRDYNSIPKIHGNMTQLEEVFFNFIDNAYDATVERRTLLKEPGYRGKITVSAKPKDGALEIIVQDNGMGIKDGQNEKIFTPFFTTKTSSRKGTGLGLYVIRRIITDTHKGKISFESQYKVGTRFILELPVAK